MCVLPTCLQYWSLIKILFVLGTTYFACILDNDERPGGACFVRYPTRVVTLTLAVPIHPYTGELWCVVTYSPPPGRCVHVCFYVLQNDYIFDVRSRRECCEPLQLVIWGGQFDWVWTRMWVNLSINSYDLWTFESD